MPRRERTRIVDNRLDERSLSNARYRYLLAISINHIRAYHVCNNKWSMRKKAYRLPFGLASQIHTHCTHFHTIFNIRGEYYWSILQLRVVRKRWTSRDRPHTRPSIASRTCRHIANGFFNDIVQVLERLFANFHFSDFPYTSISILRI